MPNLPKPRLRRARAQSGLVAPAPEHRGPNVEQIDAEGLRWVNIENPGAPERAWLEENFDFHALDLEDVLSRNQRPKIDVYASTCSSSFTSPSSTPRSGAWARASSTSWSAPAT